MACLDERIEEQLHPLEAAINRLDTIDGMDRRGAQNLLAELGPDMAQYPSADHVSSWAGMSPGNDESAGHLLKDEADYRDLGSAYFDRRRRDRTPKHLVRRLEGLGYEVKLEPKAA